MQKLLLLVALVALTIASDAPKRIQVKHEAQAHVTDVDRMNYDGLLNLEQAHPAALDESIHPDDIAHFMEAAIGTEWRKYVEIDESEPISYLELIRLSTSVNFLNADLERQDKAARGYDGDAHSIEANANICMCHGTFHSSFHSASGGATDERGMYPFKGVRVLQKGGTYYGNNPYPHSVPQDCVMCEGLTNCRSCCHGPCTIGTPADYEAAVATSADWPLGLYPCPDAWQFTDDAESDFVNDISACTVEVTSCSDAVALCSCSQKRNLMQTLGCDCMDVMVLCDDCFQAWDAIDKYKHCDCVDYARYYQMDRPESS